MDSKIAVITGASSGIGAATARALAQAGYRCYIGARRVERLQTLAAEIDAIPIALDVTNLDSIRAFCTEVPAQAQVLVNNAGGALGLAPVSQSDDEQWITMWQTNVLGLMRMTRELLPKLIAGRGHIVNITSVAAREAYPNGAGYTTVKHAARVITQTLRTELNGQPVRITDIAPGLVETEFSVVRFDGDQARADKVYEDMTPLCAEDIAECVAWAVSRPPHVNIDEILVKPIAQASATQVARGKGL